MELLEFHEPYLYSTTNATPTATANATATTAVEDCQLVTDRGRRHIQSTDVHTCAVPRTQTQLGDRGFMVAGPQLWNNLPVELRQRDICLSEFRRLLKTFLFC